MRRRRVPAPALGRPDTPAGPSHHSHPEPCAGAVGRCAGELLSSCVPCPAAPHLRLQHRGAQVRRGESWTAALQNKRLIPVWPMKQRCAVWPSNLPGERGDAAPDAEGGARAGLLTSRALVPFPLLPTRFPTVVPLGERRFASDGFLTLSFVSCPFRVTWARTSSGAVTLQGGSRAHSSQRLHPGPWLASAHPYLAVGSPSWCVGRAHSRVSRP